MPSFLQKTFSARYENIEGSHANPYCRSGIPDLVH
jgi:hypothetical protein